MNVNPDKSHLLSPQSFQELIRGRTLERKEHVREKRQDGLRRIAAMKSRSGVNPLDLFPKEIWWTIMHKLYPEDRASICQIHPMFQDLMKDNHIQTVLLPQALNLVLDHVKNKNNDTRVYYTGNDISQSELLPFIKLREVSKSLRLTIDRWFQKKIEEELYEHENPVKPSPWNPVSRMVFSLDLNLDRLNGLYENYLMALADKGKHRSPPPSTKAFFLRSIDVKMSKQCLYNNNFGFDMDTDYENVRVNLLLPFRLALFKLLGLVGHQILSFKLKLKNADYFDLIGVGIQDHYYFMQQCCLLMPNLRRLQIHFHAGGGSFSLSKKEQRDLFKYIGKFPFPTLRKLERVDFTQNMNISASPKIYDAILKVNPQVKIMKFVGEDEYLAAISQETLKALKLKSFSWENISFLPSPSWPGWPSCSRGYENDFDLIHKSWPLKVMELHPKFLNLNFVFRALKAFPTLEKLTLVVTPDEMRKSKIEKNIGYLHLPNLTHFDCAFSGKIDYDRDDVNFFFSLQFLLYAKKLEWLRWTYLGNVIFYGSVKNRDDAIQEYLEKQECPERMLDFRSGRRDLTDSNIWKVFPRLEMVEVVNGRNISDDCDEWMVKRHYRPT